METDLQLPCLGTEFRVNSLLPAIGLKSSALATASFAPPVLLADSFNPTVAALIVWFAPSF